VVAELLAAQGAGVVVNGRDAVRANLDEHGITGRLARLRP
jgi:hypothetical protein